MPANLPPQYYELERKFKVELDNKEKLKMAQELLRMMPKHKGTNRLQGEMKTKISDIKKLVASGDKVHGANKTVNFDSIDKEGCRQIILIGPPNCGKSSLLENLTEAKPIVADYPYSSREPLAGMMTYKAVPFQLIDTPPISEELYESYMNSLIRNADLVVLVADLSAKTMVDDIQFILDKMEERGINFQAKLSEDHRSDKVDDKMVIVAAHKTFEDESGHKFEQLKELMSGYSITKTSILDEETLQNFQQAIFGALKILRVFTKKSGQEADFDSPIVLPIGSTVEQAAESLHKEIAQKLKFSRIWGQGKHDGQRVNRDFVLTDGDIVEFHI